MPRTQVQRRVGNGSAQAAAAAGGRARIQVISRAAQVLRALQGRPEGASLGELAGEVALPRSTVQRIVDALDAEGLVIAASSQGGVRLGPALLSLAAATRFDIVETARPVLDSLARATGETVDLAIANQDRVVFVDQVPGIHRLAAVSAVGVAFPMHCCANGKAMLAAMDDLELRRVRARLNLAPRTRNTRTSWRALEAELARVRKDGIAHDREENSLGISAVAMALRTPDGQLAAISIPVPTQRFKGALQSLEAALRRHHRKLSKLLPS